MAQRRRGVTDLMMTKINPETLLNEKKTDVNEPSSPISDHGDPEYVQESFEWTQATDVRFKFSC